MNGSTRSYEMAKRLVAKGHQVNMITSLREPTSQAGWQNTVEDGINVYWYPVQYSNSFSFGKRLVSFIKFTLLAALKAAKLPADIVFATSTPLTIALSGIYTAKRQKCPMVFEVRDVWPLLPIAVGALKNPLLIKMAEWLESFAYSKSSHIVALSPGMKDEISKKYPAKNITVIPNSSDLDLFHSRALDTSKLTDLCPKIGNGPVIAYIGTLGKVNGVEYLTRIALEARKHNSDLQFLVAGQGAEQERILLAAEKYGVLNKNFHLIPPVPKKMVPSIFHQTTISLSLVIDVEEMWANSANKFFDSLASSTPIAINYKGWQADLIEKYHCGIVLPPNDPGNAYHLLDKLAHDKNRLEKMSENGLFLAKNHFSRDILFAKLEKVFLSTLQ